MVRTSLFLTAIVWTFVTSVAFAEPKTVHLLTVGNSFAENSLKFLPELAESAGHTLVVGRANLGGCSLERHWKHAAAFDKDPESKDGSPYGKGKRSLDELLRSKKWDFVTIQQVSYRSHDPATYAPFAQDLHAYIKERAPDAKIMAHQIWAYRVDDQRFSPKNTKESEPRTQREMYEQVRKAYHALAEELNLGIIPSGDAMFLADTDPEWGFEPDESFDSKKAVYPELPDQKHSLHVGWTWKKSGEGQPALRLDGHHANRTGEYLLGCVWFETLFGEDVSENPFVPEGLTGEYAQFLRATAHRAVTNLKSGEGEE